MDICLTKQELSERLHLLKKIIQSVDFSLMQNVIFIDYHALYSFMSSLKLSEGGVTVAAILDEIESCIPLGLSEQSLAYFLSASKSQEENELLRLQSLFEKQARMDFIDLIRTSRTQAAWERLAAACEALRQKNVQAPCLC